MKLQGNLNTMVGITIIYTSIYTLFLIISPAINIYLNGLLTGSQGIVTPTQHTAYGVFLSNLFGAFEGTFGIIWVMLIAYIFILWWRSEPEQFNLIFRPKTRRAAGSVFYVLSFLITLIVVGAFLAVFQYLISGVQTWQQTNYPISGGDYNVIIYNLWSQGFIFLPAFVFLSLIVGLWVKSHLRRE